MKLTFSILAFSICFLIGCSPSEGNVKVPEVVKTKFASMYPNAGTTKWEMDDGKYEATFQQDKLETSVIISADGNLFQSETKMDTALLPQLIKDFAASQFPGVEITSPAKATDANGQISYEAKLDNTVYVFDVNGQYMSKKVPEKEKEKDKD